ncbi:MAG: iron dependent repressor, metal binding and dimerization domain protein, partial [Nitrososphaerota archaeon]
MPRADLSRVEAVYLVTLHKMADELRTGTSALAAKFGVRESSVVDVVRRLEEKGLLIHEPWRSIALTRRGERLAEQLIHNHRVIETYLHQVLNLPGNMVMQAITQGWGAPGYFARAGRVRSKYGERYADLIDSLISEGKARSYAASSATAA